MGGEEERKRVEEEGTPRSGEVERWKGGEEMRRGGEE